jgi:hypothetical protein
MSRGCRRGPPRTGPASFIASRGSSREGAARAPAHAEATAARFALALDLAPMIRRAWAARPDVADLMIIVAHPDDPIGAQLIACAPSMGPGPMVGIVRRADLASTLADVNPAQSRALAEASPGEPWIAVVAFWGTTAGPARSFDVALEARAPAGTVLQ